MMYSHTPVGRAVSFVVMLLLSLTAIGVGLLAFNIDVLQSSYFQTSLKSVVKPLEIAIGIAGILGLLTLLGIGGMEMAHHHHAKHHDGHHHK